MGTCPCTLGLSEAPQLPLSHKQPLRNSCHPAQTVSKSTCLNGVHLSEVKLTFNVSESGRKGGREVGTSHTVLFPKIRPLTQ